MSAAPLSFRVRRALLGLALAACGSDKLTEPTTVLPLVSVSAGAVHSCGLTAAGAAYCWGANPDGELGDSMPGDTTLPAAVAGGRTFSMLSAGEFHTCGMTSAGAAYCWGSDARGQGGNGTGSSPTPVAVTGGLTFAMVSAGGLHTCGVTTAGAAYCWGNNYDGQLGIDSSSGPQVCVPPYACSVAPVPVAGGLTFIMVSAGASHTCGVTTAHVAYCWGYNGHGQLGVDTAAGPETCGAGSQCSEAPVAVSGGHLFATVSAGTSHTCGVTTGGQAYCWGDNADGELGNGTKNPSRVPAPVSGGRTYSTVSTGVVHTCGLTSVGGAVCWGSNGAGRLGNGTTAERLTPYEVSGRHTFTAVSTAHISAHTCGVTPGHVALCWGANPYGQLGNGTTDNSPVPVAVAP